MPRSASLARALQHLVEREMLGIVLLRAESVPGRQSVGRDALLVAGAFEIAQAATAAADRPTSLAILVDTSASRAPGFAGYVDKVRSLIASIDRLT